MPKISRIIQNNFPYPPTAGQVQLFQLLDELFDSSSPRATLLVKGYAGTGKTAALSGLVRILSLFNYKALLLAPTGRAAKIVAGYTGHAAFTIHKIIYRNIIDETTGRPIFSLQKNSHKRTVFIVDEASMIQDDENPEGLSVLSDLVEYVFRHDSNKLILIGDDAQLPPVGRLYSGALDSLNLCDKYNLDVLEVSLHEVVRQEKDSGILYNATMVRKMIPRPHGVLQIKTRNFRDVFHISSRELETALQGAYDEFGLENTVIICRSNKEAVQLNKLIRTRILFREDDLETGDSVMIVRNNYFWLGEDSRTGFLTNGDFAEVLKISYREEKSGFMFADLALRLSDYPEQEPFEAKAILNTLYSQAPSLTADEFKALYDISSPGAGQYVSGGNNSQFKSDPYLNALQIKFTYAITCHKSQGGQWPVVFIKRPYLGNGQADEDYLRWLYTGISRAVKICYFVDFLEEDI
ncbi:MAG TPA: AAA family ATPase [Cyclobacteriaceae bacterium]|nr:AAA family ATPase [Cyclobacteriaceae bacterium]